MWNLMGAPEFDDESWEVKAFAEDTGNAMGTTWPPRSYNCTFCRREFKSAQALGGHMNVHRRDRARQNQVPPLSINPTSSTSSVIPAREFVANGGGLRFFYQLPNPNASIQLPSSFLSISPYPSNTLFSPSLPSINFETGMQGISDSIHGHLSKADESSSSTYYNGQEELDLELRLGHRPTPS